jgi:hypothetical protein
MIYSILDFLWYNFGYIIIAIWLISLFITIKQTIFKKEIIKKINFSSFFLIFLFYPFFKSLEMLKYSGTTWWNSGLYIWWIQLIFLIFFTLLFKKDLVHWIFKFLIWIITIILVWKYWFSNWEWVSYHEIKARWAVIFIWIFYIIEWIIISLNSNLCILKNNSEK